MDQVLRANLSLFLVIFVRRSMQKRRIKLSRRIFLQTQLIREVIPKVALYSLKLFLRIIFPVLIGIAPSSTHYAASNWTLDLSKIE